MKKLIIAICFTLPSLNGYALGLNIGMDVLKACQTTEAFWQGKVQIIGMPKLASIF
jgi:hypothetical protein